MVISIVYRPGNRSPKVMALQLKERLETLGITVNLIEDIDFLRRLLPILETPKRWKKPIYSRFLSKIKNRRKDQVIINSLKCSDAVILSECIPNAFWKGYYGIQELKQIINKPIGLLEVFLLRSAPHFIERLELNNDYSFNLYDFYLAITEKSYTSVTPKQNEFIIGLDLACQIRSKPLIKTFKALIDFKWENDESERQIQLDALREAEIEFEELSGEYSIDEIRKLYSEASLFFIQHFESFGLPIAESLKFGTMVCTPNSGWPMAFRLNKDIQLYGKGDLADCFLHYKSKEDLVTKLNALKSKFVKGDLNTYVVESFKSNYPTYYQGNHCELCRFIEFVKCN